MMGGQEKRKDRKTWKMSEEKVVGFSSASLMLRRTKGASIVKSWKIKQDHRCIPDTFTYIKNKMSAYPMNPQKLKPDSLHPTFIYIYIMFRVCTTKWALFRPYLSGKDVD